MAHKSDLLPIADIVITMRSGPRNPATYTTGQFSQFVTLGTRYHLY